MSFLKLVSLSSLIALSLPMTSRADSSEELNQILATFNSSCPSNGQWTQAALGYTNKIVGVLKEIQTDPDCRSLSGSLSDMQLMSTVFSNVVQDQTQTEISSLKSEQTELLFLIAQGGDTGSLLSQLQSVNVQLATAQGTAAANGAYQSLERKGQSLSFLVTGTKNMLAQATQNQACLKKNKSLLPAIVGLAGTVGATLVTGGGALYVAAGVEVLNLVVEGSRTHRIAREINQLDSITSATAFSCVLEGMSNQWCAAEDAKQVVTLKASSIVSAQPMSPGTPIEQGIKVISRDYPRFIRWLDTVYSGSDPANSAMGERQVEFQTLEFTYKAGRTSSLSAISTMAQDLTTYGSPDEQWTAIKTFVTKLTNNLSIGGGSSSSSSNPFYETVGSNYNTVLPWLLVGVDIAHIPYTTSGGQATTTLDSLSSNVYTYHSIGALIGNPNYVPNVAIIRTAFLALASKAQARLDQERALIMYADPCKLISMAGSSSIDGTSTYKSLQAIIAYLSAQTPPSGTFGSFQGIYGETANTLGDISRAIESTLSSTCTTSSGQLAVNHIFQLAHLENGTSYLSERLNWIVGQSLNNLVVTGQGTTPGQAAALLAADDVIQELNSYTSNLGYDAMIKDMKSSQSLLDGTMQTFSNSFADNIYQNILSFQQNAAIFHEDALGENNENWDKSCVLLLSIPKWPQNIPADICIGRSMKSEFAGWPSSRPITADMMNAPEATRAKSVCAFRDYQRENWLFQRYHERN